MTDYIVYFRVSTERQGRSGLGLDAQRSMVQAFLGADDDVLAEFTEIQSGAKDDRDILWQAIDLAKKTKSKLLIPKLDRFSRKVSFISGIIDQGIELTVCEHPTASTFFLHLLACFAEEERRQISQRTKDALAAAKQRGTILGKNSKVLAEKHRAEKRRFVSSIADQLRKANGDASSLSATARLLNERQVPTANGGKWHTQTVINYLAILKDH